MNYKSFNRGKLKRLAGAGKLVCQGYYHFDDMYGESRGKAEEIPVVYPKPTDWHDRKEGTLYLGDWDFRSKSGCAWLNENGTVTMVIHSNLNYTFRITA